MGCRSWMVEEVFVGSQDMKTLCAGIFVHLQFFLSGIPLNYWYSEVCTAYDKLSHNKCRNIFFPGLPRQEIEIIITLCFIGPSLLCIFTLWHLILRYLGYIIPGNIMQYKVYTFVHMSWKLYIVLDMNYNKWKTSFLRRSWFVKRFAYIVPDVLVTDTGLLFLYLIALENDRHVFMKNRMDYK